MVALEGLEEVRMLNPFARRRFIKTGAAASAALAFPYLRTSYAAGALSIGFWDHWVPSGADALPVPGAGQVDLRGRVMIQNRLTRRRVSPVHAAAAPRPGMQATP